MLTRALTDYLEQYLQASAISDYCPNGLQVEGVKEVRKLGVAVSASLRVIEQAVALGVDALLVHHGLFWKGDDAVITGTKRRKLDLLFRGNLNLLAYHLPLDVHPEVGNNWAAAREMGWENLEPFGDFQGVPAGVKGRFSPIKAEAFFAKLEAYYQHPVHAAPGGKEVISSAGLISGGAHRLIHQAVKAGLDCFVTGSFDEPVWHVAHEEHLHFCAVGHANTEKVGPRVLGEHLRDKWGLEVLFIEDPNPF